jgi:hypothetical protein
MSTPTKEGFTKWDVRYMTGLYDEEYDKMANQLYHEKGYVIIKNFISPEEVELCMEKIAEESTWSPKSFGAGKYREFRPTQDEERILNNPKTFLEQTVNKLVETRIRIALQPGSNGMIMNTMLVTKNFPRFDNWTEDISIHFVKKAMEMYFSWYRLMRYMAGDYFEPHLDAPAEIQSILYLTKKGINYSAGGLRGSLYNRSDNIDIDAMVEPGDLLLIDGNRFVHWVEELQTDPGRHGRITLFVPGDPHYG